MVELLFVMIIINSNLMEQKKLGMIFLENKVSLNFAPALGSSFIIK